MARPPSAAAVQAATMPSLLDRLLDEAPAATRNNAPSRAALIASIKRTLQRDLEWLLNTRRHSLGAAGKDLPELKTSLVAYGIPDFTAQDVGSDARRKGFARALEQVIRSFEPRLTGVTVTLVNHQERSLERRLRFRIEALIRVEPASEPVVFESLLDPATQSFSIRGVDHE
jgi:type VI secretion system protein ImpF